MSLEEFNSKKCDNTRGQMSWKVGELKSMCQTLNIQFKSNDTKPELCKKIARYFRGVSSSVNSPIQVVGTQSQLFNRPVASSSFVPPPVNTSNINGVDVMNSFGTKKCKDGRGPSSWTVAQLKEICKSLKIPINSRMMKNDYCLSIKNYIKSSTGISPVIPQEPSIVQPTYYYQPNPSIAQPTTANIPVFAQDIPVPTINVVKPVSSNLTYKQKQIINAMNPSKAPLGLVSIRDRTLQNIKDQFIEKNCSQWSISQLKEICDTLNLKYSIRDDKKSICFKIENFLFGGEKRKVDTTFLKNYNMNSIADIFNVEECQNVILPNKYTVDELIDVGKILNIKLDKTTSKNQMCKIIGDSIKTANINDLVDAMKKSGQDDDDMRSEISVELDNSYQGDLNSITDDLVKKSLVMSPQKIDPVIKDIFGEPSVQESLLDSLIQNSDNLERTSKVNSPLMSPKDDSIIKDIFGNLSLSPVEKTEFDPKTPHKSLMDGLIGDNDVHTSFTTEDIPESEVVREEEKFLASLNNSEEESLDKEIAKIQGPTKAVTPNNPYFEKGDKDEEDDSQMMKINLDDLDTSSDEN